MKLNRTCEKQFCNRNMKCKLSRSLPAVWKPQNDYAGLGGPSGLSTGLWGGGGGGGLMVWVRCPVNCLCMDQNYFTFDNKFYRQTSGLPMGSPLSPLLADIFMDSLEQTIFLSNHSLFRNITYWHRYVDDILVLWTGTTRQIY